MDDESPQSSLTPPTSPTSGSIRDAEDQKMLLRFVADRDVPCPRCGYNLRNLTHAVCPECEESLLLKVGVSHVRLGALLLTLIPGAFCLVAFGIFLVMCLLHGPPSARESGIWLTIGFLVLSSAATVIVCLNHGWFRKQHPATQAGLAVCTWVIHLLAFLIFLNHV